MVKPVLKIEKENTSSGYNNGQNYLIQKNQQMLWRIKELDSFDILIYDITRNTGIEIKKLLPENIAIKYTPQYSSESIYGRKHPIRFLTAGDSITYSFNIIINEDYVRDYSYRVGGSRTRFNSLTDFIDTLKQFEFPTRPTRKPEVYIKIGNQIEATGYMNISIDKSLPALHNSGYSIVSIGITFTVLYDETNYSLIRIDDGMLYTITDLSKEQQEIFESKNISIDDFYYSVVDTSYDYLLTSETKYKALQNYYRQLHTTSEERESLANKRTIKVSQFTMPSIPWSKHDVYNRFSRINIDINLIDQFVNTDKYKNSEYMGIDLGYVVRMLYDIYQYLFVNYKNEWLTGNGITIFLVDELTSILDIYKNINLLNMSYMSKNDLIKSINKTISTVKSILRNDKVSLFSNLSNEEVIPTLYANWYEDFRKNRYPLCTVVNFNEYKEITERRGWYQLIEFLLKQSMLSSGVENIKTTDNYISTTRDKLKAIETQMYVGATSLNIELEASDMDGSFQILEKGLFEIRLYVIELFETDRKVAKNIVKMAEDLLNILQQKLDYLEGRVI